MKREGNQVFRELCFSKKAKRKGRALSLDVFSSPGGEHFQEQWLFRRMKAKSNWEGKLERCMKVIKDRGGSWDWVLFGVKQLPMLYLCGQRVAQDPRARAGTTGWVDVRG